MKKNAESYALDREDIVKAIESYLMTLTRTRNDREVFTYKNFDITLNITENPDPKIRTTILSDQGELLDKYIITAHAVVKE